jgi:lysophospholipase L1-like esterase
MPDVVEKNKLILVKIINFLKEKNISCIMVTSPYYKTYTQETTKKDILEMEKITKDLEKNYNVPYYNFSIDSSISKNNKYYFNADHLNDEGKRIFTEKLLNTILKK